MPAFITNGPDIPESLLEAHEEGRIVFFCGAGISYPANLPGFEGLVDQIYAKLHFVKTPVEKETYQKKQFDTTLGLLECRHPGKRLAVREALASVLDTSQVAEESTATHKALLQLAINRSDNKVRLVTTNFDRLFQDVITKDNLIIPCYSAPLLPIPKKSRWNGIVYLHGLLSASSDETELNRLVLTSGDFGLAYLTERWASRFVTELFRHYTICFVGYGINDPVLRYMMDALAADELLGEARPEAFAFAGYNTGEKEQAKIEWEIKGVTPLLYEVQATHDHSALHQTLKEWADTYRDGVQGKEMIVSQHATSPPLGQSRADYAVGRVLWALTDGLAAKHFADLNPVPPLEWLVPLSEKHFEHWDLSRFKVTANSAEDKDLHFSMLHRPTPYTHSPWMCIVANGARDCCLDSLMFHLSRWLTRHLNNPKL